MLHAPVLTRLRLGITAGCLLALVACADDQPKTAPEPASSPTADSSASASPSPSASTSAAAPAPVSPQPLKGGFADDFDGSTLDATWSWLHDDEGWPDAMREVAVRKGSLELVPWTTAWYADFHGPFVFRRVTGDFVATARVLSRGVRGPIPNRTYSFTGLMARAARDVTPETWTPGGENHVFITSGVGDTPGLPKLETKTTEDSRSTLTLTPIAKGWTDLAVVRGGASFVMLYRETGGDWQVSDVFDRPDLPRTLQLGISVYTDWEGMADYQQDPAGYHQVVLRREPDLHAYVDRVAAEALPRDLDIGGWADATQADLLADLSPLLPR